MMGDRNPYRDAGAPARRIHLRAVIMHSAIALAIVGALAASIPLAAQTPTSGETPTVGEARIHYAGNDLLLLDNIVIDGQPFSVYIALDDERRWRVTSLEAIPERSAVPQDIVLDLATLTVRDARTLQVEHVFLDGTFYSGTITFDEALERVASYEFLPTSPPDPADNRVVAQLAEAYAMQLGTIDSASNGGDTRTDPEVGRDVATGSTGVASGETGSDTGAAAAGSTGSSEPRPIISPDDYDAAIALVDDFSSRLNRVSATVDRVSETVERLERSVEALNETVTRGFAEGERRLDRIDRLAAEGNRRLDGLAAEGDRRVDRLIAEIAAAREAAREAIASNRSSSTTAGTSPRDRESTTVAEPPMDTTLTLIEARVAMTRVESIDLRDAEATRGSWETTESTARQTNREARFAKLRLPYRQDGRPRLYRFLTRSLDAGWAGVGLHFSVEAVEAPGGYGHGESVLVWLTRDEAVNGVDDTFLEIYRSNDDVHMDRIAQAQTRNELSEEQAVEVLVDPGSGYITVAVNGVEHVRYRLIYPVGSSMEIAVRALGRAEFRHLEVRTLP